MNQMPKIETPKPFKQEALDLPRGNLFTRSLTAKVLAVFHKCKPEQVAERMWPNDRELASIYKANANPAMVAVPGWAAELAQKKIADVVSTLGAATCAIDVMQAGLLVAWGRYGAIAVPAFVSSANGGTFVADGDPIPVKQFVDSAALLNPYKVASISALTREMLESSNAEAFITDVLVKSAAVAIDAAFFDANPATAARPAGIRNGVATIAPSANADTFGSVFEDVGNLVGAVGAVGGKGPFYLIGSAGRMMSFAGRYDLSGPPGAKSMIPTITGEVGGDMLAVAPRAIAAALDVDPEVEIANAGTLVMDDSAPGVPGDASGPTRSLFQTDSLAIKVRWPVTWMLRDARGVAWTTPAWK